MLKLIGLGGIDLLGISLDYLIAVVLIGGGIYLTGIARWIGVGVVALGVTVGAVAYGKTQGAADCISAERLAAVESERDSLKSEKAGWIATAALNRSAAERMRADKEKTDVQLAKWQTVASKLSAKQRAARAATRDDDKRVCELVKGRAPGC